TAAGIPTWSPTVVLICRSTAYVWQSGRDAQFSADCGRTCSDLFLSVLSSLRVPESRSLREAGVNEPLSTSQFRDNDPRKRINEYNFERAGLTV
ncbi:hypothetical protein KCU92_g1881, partial [Aureobasidium melanogenum]